jgi:hypothetical protein
MKQTKKFLRSKQLLRDIRTFRWGFPLDYFKGGVWATNGRPGVLQEPITLESIQKACESVRFPPVKLSDTNPKPFVLLMVMPPPPRAFFRDMEGV